MIMSITHIGTTKGENLVREKSGALFGSVKLTKSFNV